MTPAAKGPLTERLEVADVLFNVEPCIGIFQIFFTLSCIVSDKASHIFKHLQNSEHCRALCLVDCFHILDHASMGFQLKIKEAFDIQPSLNQQLHHVNLKLSL